MLPFEAAYAPSSSYLLPKDLNLHFVCKVAQLKFRQEGKTRIRALAAEQTVINQPLPPRTLQSSITSSSTTRSDAPKQISVISTSRAASVCSSIFLNPPTAQSSVTHKIERRSMVTHPTGALMRPITFDKMMEINRTFQREHEQVLARKFKNSNHLYPSFWIRSHSLFLQSVERNCYVRQKLVKIVAEMRTLMKKLAP